MGNKELTTPKCLYCDKKLNPIYKEIRDQQTDLEWYQFPKFKIRIIGYGKNGYFCSQSCGFNYAVDMLNEDPEQILKRSDLIIQANEERGFNQEGEIYFDELKAIVKEMEAPHTIKRQDPKLWIRVEHLLKGGEEND